MSIIRLKHSIGKWRNLQGHFALFAASLIWGTSFLFTRLLLYSITPTGIALIRFAIASIILLAYIKISRKQSINIFGKDVVRLILLGACGVTIYYYGENTSLLTITTSSASLIVSLAPAVTTILSVLFLKEKASWTSIFGIFIGFLGAILVITNGHNVSGVGAFRSGYLYALLATVSFSVYTILGRQALSNRSTTVVTAITFIYGSILLIPFTLRNIWLPGRPEVTPQIGIEIIYLAIVCSIGGYFLWNWGLKTVEAGKASVYLNIVPLTAIILGVIFLREPLTIFTVIGGIFILSGVYLASIHPQLSHIIGNLPQ